MLDLNNPEMEPINLVGGINSPADDFSFIVDKTGKNGYFSSDRTDLFVGKKVSKD